MQKISFQELIDRRELQHIQDEFALVTGMGICCLDDEYLKITELSGREGLPEDYILQTGKAQIQQLLERVQEGSLEEQAAEALEENRGHVAAIAIRLEKGTVLYWLVFDFSGTEEQSFYYSLDLLRDTSKALFASKESCFCAEAENRKSRFVQQEMVHSLHTIEATTQVVQLLDSDDLVETLLHRWLSIIAEYEQPDSAQIFQLNGSGSMDVLCEWCNVGIASAFERTGSLPVFRFLEVEKPLVLSGGKGLGEYCYAMEEAGIRAVMVFPVLVQENGARMAVSLNYEKRDHTWEVSEIKFAADAVRVLQSILTRRIQKNSLAGSYAALESILDNVGCSIYVTDKATDQMLFANKRLQNTFSKELEKGNFQKLLIQGTGQGKSGGFYEICHRERDRWYDLLYKEIAWVDGREAVLYSLYDITDKKLYQRKIEQQAYTDFLTGLYNRMCCEKDLARQIDEAKKSNSIGALLYLDLDDFKHINDGLGHQYGDVLLKSISGCLKRIDGIENTCYRMGGDEFVIVIPPSSYQRFDGIVEDIKKIFNKPWFLKDADYYCTMSMGIVIFPDSGDSVADLIKKADIAMYEAKRSGKNRVAKYNDSIDSLSGKRLDMEKNMRDATVEGYKEFQVFYQPVIDLEGKKPKCVGAEALIRWNSAKLGFISPAEFIPLAEYLGLINPIGNHVLKEACRQCKEWNDNGYPHFKVNVNLSVVQLLQADIVEIVEETLKESGIKPHNLTLEVTESLAINDMERMKEILSKIKALGVKIALDDFGTGYSSLNHIREIPFDVIKVDQSFVKDLAEDAYSQSFIKMVAELAQTIGVSICVEGIETSAQYKVLQGMKVKYIQGYYFDKPMTKDDFERKYTAGIAKSRKNV